jgi:hypothetical protein
MLMTPSEDECEANKTFIVQASLAIVNYDHQIIFKVQATGQSE